MQVRTRAPPNSVAGVLNGRALAPGAYRAVLTEKDSGGRSTATDTIVRFTIVRPLTHKLDGLVL